MPTASLQPAVGRDALDYVDALHPDRPLVVHTYRPAAHGPDDPVVLVQHGVKRNGDDYRDFWIEAADKHRLLVVATTFGDAQYPKPESYNNGMVAVGGAVHPRENWTYAILPRVVDALRAGGVTRLKRVRLFGHSAGGQFTRPTRRSRPPTPAGTPCRPSSARSPRDWAGWDWGRRTWRAGWATR
jgi:poly(3-hydroxybutyrate) depolymerase